MLEDIADEAQLRELSNWMREHMQVYVSGAALEAHMPDLIPEHIAHALLGRCGPRFNNPANIQEYIASATWRLPRHAIYSGEQSICRLRLSAWGGR